MRTTPSPRLIGFKNSGTSPDFSVPVRVLSFSRHIRRTVENGQTAPEPQAPRGLITPNALKSKGPHIVNQQ